MTEQTKAEAGAKLADDLRTWMSDARSVKSLGQMLADYDAATKPRTITVNGVEVPEPVREALAEDQPYYMPNIEDLKTWSSEISWIGDEYDHCWLSRGLIHLTREAAESHARALIGASEVRNG